MCTVVQSIVFALSHVISPQVDAMSYSDWWWWWPLDIMIINRRHISRCRRLVVVSTKSFCHPSRVIIVAPQ